MTERHYDGFISYSHGADAALAPALQRGLERIAKPWYRRKSLDIFRDQTNLAAAPHLWDTIVTNLQRSRWFVLLCSPAAARSRWVAREVEWWLAHRSADSLLLVLTEGLLSWDDAGADFDWATTDALPRSLAGRFQGEPHHIDLRWARGRQDLTLQHSAFRADVVLVAATLRGLMPEQMDGESLRAHRRNRAWAWSAGTALLALTMTVIVFGILAQQASRTAERRLADSHWQRAARARDSGNRLESMHLLARAAAGPVDAARQRNAGIALHEHLGPVALVGLTEPYPEAVREDNVTLAKAPMVRLSSDGHMLVTAVSTLGSIAGMSRLRAFGADGTPAGPVIALDFDILGIRLAGDGEWALVWGGGVRDAPGRPDEFVQWGAVEMRRLRDGSADRPRAEHGAMVVGVVMNAAGQQAVSWDEQGQVLLHTLAGPPQPPLALPHARPAKAARFDHDHRTLLTLDEAGVCRRWPATGAAAETVDCWQVLPLTSWDTRGRLPPQATWQTADDEPVISQIALDTLRAWFGPAAEAHGSVTGAGDLAATWAHDGQELLLLERPEGRRRCVVDAAEPVRGARFSPTGERVLVWTAAARRLRLAVYDTATCAAVGSSVDVDLPGGPFRARFNVQGTLAAVDVRYGAMELLDLQRGQVLRQPQAERDDVRDVRFSSDGRRWLSWGYSGRARLHGWRFDWADTLAILEHEGFVHDTQFAAGEAAVVTVSGAGTGRLWRLDAAPQARAAAPTTAERWAMQGTMGASFGGDGALPASARLWDLATLRPQAGPLVHAPPPAASGSRVRQPTAAGTFDGTGRRLMTWDDDGQVYLWSVPGGHALQGPLQLGQPVVAARWSPDGTHVAAAGRTRLALWRTDDGRPIGLLPEFPDVVGGFGFSPDGTRLLAWSGKNFSLFDATTGAALPGPPAHDVRIAGVAFGADSRRLLSWSSFAHVGGRRNGAVHVGSVAGDATSMPLWRHTAGIAGAAWQDGERRVLAWSNDGMVKLLEPGRPDALATLRHSQAVAGAVADEPRRRLLSWSADGTARWWSSSDGRPLTVPMRHGAQVVDAAMAADGSLVVTLDEHGRIRLWDGTDATLLAAPLEVRAQQLRLIDIDRSVVAWGPAGLLRWRFDPGPIDAGSWRARVERRTGTVMDEQGNVGFLDRATWARRPAD